MENNTTLPQTIQYTFTPLSLYTTNEHNRIDILRWKINNGYPRLEARVNLPTPPEHPMDRVIVAPLNYFALNMIIGFIEAIITAENSTVYKTEHKNTLWENGVKTDKITIQAVTYIGKDENGVIFIALTSGDKPKVKFELLPDEKWYNFSTSKGVLTKGELSAISTKGYLEQLKSIYNSHLSKFIDVYEK